MPPKSGFAPKPRVLTPNETPESFQNWKENLMLNLTLDGTFEFLLDDDVTWQSASVRHRGFESDTDGLSGQQKAAVLKTLLGTIAGFAPVISRQFITQEALSLSHIWSRLRIRYGFRKSGGLILDLASVHLEEGESHEGLWERLHAFTCDNLLNPADGLQHLNDNNPAREEMSATLLNTTVVLWLRAIHPSLPALVKQKYSTELRGKTIATIREDISESLEPLLAELGGNSPASIARSATFNRGGFRRRGPGPPQQSRSPRSCPICLVSDRPKDHFLSECPYLPEADR